jgi:glycosyltransferase involved in cell wall biosynthesis
MDESRTIGISIPTYNRIELLFNSFSRVINNDSVAEVTIVDDASNIEIYAKIMEMLEALPKVRLFRNETNRDCFKNKFASLAYSTQDWCILLDSDNEIDADYILKLLNITEWDEKTAYLPAWAKPHFNYTKFEGLEITAANVHKYMDDADFRCCLNTANYFVNRYFYMQCWDGSVDPHTSDSIYMNYLWLKNGGKLYIVPGLTYQHRVDNHQNEEPGHYQKNNFKTGNLHAEVEQKLRELR